MAAKPIIRGVVFDMDGTLTVPVIDFAEMRSRVGVPPGHDILDAINSWEPERRQRAYDIIKDIEDDALKRLQIMPGALELCQLLDSKGVPRGLITRNVRNSVDHFHARGLPAWLNPFAPAVSRECGFAYKPSPEALLHICTKWGIEPGECVMVGDSAKDDVVCGNRAGALTILLDWRGHQGHTQASLEGECRPTLLVNSLHQVVEVLQDQYQLLPPPAPLEQAAVATAAGLAEDVAAIAEQAAGGRHARGDGR